MDLKDTLIFLIFTISWMLFIASEIMYARKSRKTFAQMEDRLKDEVKTSKSTEEARYSNNRTFTVISKDNNSMYDVFDIAYDKAGYPHFLIYKNSTWVRQSAKYFYPIGLKE